MDEILAAYFAAPDDRQAVRGMIEGIVRYAAEVNRPRLPRLRRWFIWLLVLGFALFVWPTPYRDIGRGGQVNRITGAICRVGASCW